MDEKADENRDVTRPEGETETPKEPIVASVVDESTTASLGQRWSSPPYAKKPKREPQPMSWREPLAALALVVLCDITMFRGHGWAGYAALFVIAPVLLCFGRYRPRLGWATWIVSAMLVVLAVKMLWCVPWLGWLVIATGFSLVVAFDVGLSGQPPYVLGVVLLVSQTILAGYERLNDYGRRAIGTRTPTSGVTWGILLPTIVLVAFSLIFTVANPNILKYVSHQAEVFFEQIQDWLANFSAWEVVFWIAVLWVSVGLLRPLAERLVAFDDEEKKPAETTSEPAVLFAACRNTLVTVIILFAVYLVFEFKTLWFHEFPAGFPYSGYAHEGAAWLTVALGLSTIILSGVFSGKILLDPRVGQLRGLAWIWSLQNFILAVAVYNRLWIYVGFNGMTRMRIVGFFGTSAVVVGFIFVLWKIAKNHSFSWLIQRHLWTLAVALYLLVLTPVDVIVVRYNVNKILAGDMKPSVQFTVHPISSEGITYLAPLLNCSDPIIREGTRAQLAEHSSRAEVLAAEREKYGWTMYQKADVEALDWFRENEDKWAGMENVI